MNINKFRDVTTKVIPGDVVETKGIKLRLTGT